MITRIELYKDGSRMVFHATDGGAEKWNHRPEEECRVCQMNRSEDAPPVEPPSAP